VDTADSQDILSCLVRRDLLCADWSMWFQETHVTGTIGKCASQVQAFWVNVKNIELQFANIITQIQQQGSSTYSCDETALYKI
jgi:hypothetical protein